MQSSDDSLREIERGNVRKRLSLKFKTINDCIAPIVSGMCPIWFPPRYKISTLDKQRNVERRMSMYFPLLTWLNDERNPVDNWYDSSRDRFLSKYSFEIMMKEIVWNNCRWDWRFPNVSIVRNLSKEHDHRENYFSIIILLNSLEKIAPKVIVLAGYSKDLRWLMNEIVRDYLEG